MIRLFLIFLFLFPFCKLHSQEFDEKKLLFQLEKLSEKEQVVHIDSLANTYNIENNEEGIEQIDFLIRYARKKKLPEKVMAGLLYSRGSLYRKQGEYSPAINDFRAAEKIYKKIKNESGLSSVYTAYSNVYYKIGDNIKAINYIHQSIQVAEKAKNSDGLAVSYNTLANIYLSLKNYDSSLFYYKKSYLIYKNKNSTYQKSLLLDNISMVYVESDIIDSAYIYSKLAREEAKKLKDTYLELQLLLNAAAIEDKLNHQDYHLEIARRAKFLADSLQVPIYQLYTNANYANALYKNKKTAEALTVFRKILPQAKSFSDYSLLDNVYETMSNIFSAIRQTDSAFHYYKLSVAMQDTMNKHQASDEVNELIARNQLENKENRIQHEKELRLAEQQTHEAEKANYEETQKWQWWIIIISVIAIVLTVALLIIINKRLTENRKLNALMREKNNEIIEKNKSLHESKQEIISSINYAKRIQFALLAHDELLKKNLPEHFILFKPKDIVSGDFYWATGKQTGNEKEGGEFYLAVCDSTGHGVPGAFMSLLNISFLNEAINEKNIHEPHKVLNHVKERLIKNMEGAKDGMDAVLVRLSEGKIHYAAAHNHPVLIRNGLLTELPADKMPVGLDERTDSFTLHELELKKGDLLFFYTDGYADQFGGPKNKKFKNVNLHQVLLSVADKNMAEIRNELLKVHENWKKDAEQVDDICIIGLRI